MFVFSIVLFWRKFKRQATNEPTSCGFSELFNWCQTMDGVFSYHILLPSIQYSKCCHLCVKWMKRAKHFWSWGLIWSWGTERAGDTFLSSLMNEQSWITSIYLILNYMTLLISLQLTYMIYLLQIDSATWQHIPLRARPKHGLYYIRFWVFYSIFAFLGAPASSCSVEVCRSIQ